MPHVSNKFYFPLALATNKPLQVRVAGSLFAVYPAILKFSKVALKEADLMLVCCTGYIGRRPFNREMVIDSAFVDSSSRLRNKFCAPHIRVPFGSVVDGDLSALLGSIVCRILIVG